MLLRRVERLWCAGAVTIVVGLGSAPALMGSDASTHKIEITLTGPDCFKASGNINIVLDGADGDAFPISGTPCQWSYDIPGRPFSISKAFFSLRLGGARTECRHASERPRFGPDHEPVAQLLFRYKPGSAKSVNVGAEGAQKTPVYLGYVRYVHKDSTVNGSIKCEEKGLFHELGRQPIFDVNFAAEDLRLQFLTSANGDSKNLGLLVNDEAVLREMKKGSRVVLDQDAVVKALDDQVRRGITAPPQDPRENSHENNKKMLDASRLKRLEIVVP